MCVINLAPFHKMTGEVFRAPACPLLFTTCVSAGMQFLAVAVSGLLFFVLYPVYIERNYRLLIELYSLLALLGGLGSGSLYAQQRGRC